MKKNMEEKLPQIVEDRLQEAYEQIRKGEIKQMKKKKRTYHNWMSAAAVLILIITIPSVVYAAVVYFQKTEHRNADELTYQFTLNYELVPGEYQVTPSYIPEGLKDTGDGKYLSADNSDNGWITVMPVYTTAELEKIDGELTVTDIEKIEHTILSGMDADVITFQEAQKYQSPTYLFLFNENDGYVLHIIADCTIDQKELLKFADSLTVTRVGDGHYETEEEKALREQAEGNTDLAALESQKNWDALIELGIPEDKIFQIGEELYNRDNAYSYTVTDYEYLNNIEEFDERDFFDYTRFDGWLNTDKTLHPYTRMHYDKNGRLLEETQAEQEFLCVNIKVRCYTGCDVPTSFTLEYVTKKQNNTYTWAEDVYTPVPEENYFLQIDNSAVYFNKAVNTSPAARNDFFFREMQSGEELEYTLLFVIDKDRKNDFLLYPTGGNNSIWQTESETAKEIREELDGYIRLQ